MATEPNWHEIYSLLGVTSEDEWDTVKNAYRSLAQANHPDRFPEGSEARQSAELKFVDINNAYQKISKYYRDNNRLPGKRFQPSAPRPDKTAGSSSANTGFSNSGRHRRKSRPKHRLKTAIKFALLVGAFYYAYEFMFEPSGVRLVTQPDETSSYIPAPGAATENLQSAEDNSYFTPGSTMGEVYAVQGTPTRTEGNTWYYGSSRITFEGGVVKSWNESIDNPLKIKPVDSALGTRTAHSRLTSRFTYGSTKADVLALQGKPTHMTNTVWDYGLAKVYFENGRVVKWTDSPLLPLKVENSSR